MLQLGDLFRMVVKIKECINQFNYEINKLSSEVDLNKPEKKMVSIFFFNFESLINL